LPDLECAEGRLRRLPPLEQRAREAGRAQVPLGRRHGRRDPRLVPERGRAPPPRRRADGRQREGEEPAAAEAPGSRAAARRPELPEGVGAPEEVEGGPPLVRIARAVAFAIAIAAPLAIFLWLQTPAADHGGPKSDTQRGA